MPDRILRDWTDSEAVARAGDDGESLFVRLIQRADDYGCYLATPKLLRMYLYPWRDDVRTADVVKRLQKCIAARLISAYEINLTGVSRWISADDLAVDVADDRKWFLIIHNYGQRIRDIGTPKQVKPKCPQPPLTCPPNIRAEEWSPPPYPEKCPNPPQVAANRGNPLPYANANANANASSNASAILISGSPTAKVDVAEPENLVPVIDAKPTKRKREPPIPLPEIPDCLDTPDFREAWSKWLGHRREKKDPVTSTAAILSLKKLMEIGVERSVAAIEYSVRNGWKGIFEENGAKHVAGRPNRPYRPTAEQLGECPKHPKTTGPKIY